MITTVNHPMKSKSSNKIEFIYCEAFIRIMLKFEELFSFQDLIEPYRKIMNNVK